MPVGLSSLSALKKGPLKWPNGLKSSHLRGGDLRQISSPFVSLCQDLSRIRGVCLDIDDTLSTDGKLTARAFQSLWDLKNAGYLVVPITGRPAGWCDHIVRFWPVDAVIGENGAFTLFMNDGVRKSLLTPSGLTGETGRQQLAALAKKIQRAFPEAQFASDQKYREHDLAIDFCEDVTPWSKKEIQRLVDFCKGHGAQAKVSSIHVNTWYGDYDKFSGFQNWIAKGLPGLRGSREKMKSSDLSSWIYVGDSPNDEPLFKAFRYSVGVANLKPFLKSLEHPPRWITSKRCGEGFAQVADFLIQLKARAR